MLFAALAAAAAVTPQQAKAMVRITRSVRADESGWLLAQRRRELLVRDGDRLMKLRLIELE
jgi:hypothetical protein